MVCILEVTGVSVFQSTFSSMIALDLILGLLSQLEIKEPIKSFKSDASIKHNHIFIQSHFV